MTKIAIKTAMIVDDSQADQLLYSMVLERSPSVENILTFSYAEDALAFLKKADRDPVDVIFLDINMPRMNGFEFLEAAHQECDDGFTRAVIVMLTTSLDPDDRKRAESYDVVKEFINKPLNDEHVEHVISIVERSDPF